MRAPDRCCASNHHQSGCLEILLSPHESIAILAGLAVHVAFHMQLTSQSFGAAEENPSFARTMQFLDGAENHIPVGPSEIGRSSESSNGICFTRVEHNILSIAGRDLCS